MKSWQKIFRDEAMTMVKVLDLIRRKGPIAQAELARSMNLTRASVNVYAKKLLQKGVIHQVGRGDVGVGRPQVLLDIERNTNGVIGICLDYPFINAGLGDFSEKVLVSRSVDISKVTALTELETSIVKIINDLSQEAAVRKITLHGVCFGTGGVLEGMSGKILNHVNYPLANGLDPQALIFAAIKVPVYVIPLGVVTYWGALQPEDENRRIFQVFWDLGVGVLMGNGYDVNLSGFTRDKQGIGRGLRDMGHVIWRPEGHLCRCGQKGCLEAYFGGWAMLRDLGEKMEWLEFLERARQEDPKVKSLIIRCARELGSELGWVFTVHQPCKIRFSGEIPDCGEWVFKAFYEGLESRLGKEVAAGMEPEGVYDFPRLQVYGGCRLANHLRFNLPLLPIVRITEDVDETIGAVLSE